MLTHYNVMEMALRFASFEPFMKQSCGFQANEASDVIDCFWQNESSSDTAL